jgi:hypothetical protein
VDLCRTHIAVHVGALLFNIGLAVTTIATWSKSVSSDARNIGSFGGGSASSAYLFFAASLLSTLVSFAISAIGAQQVFRFISSLARGGRRATEHNVMDLDEVTTGGTRFSVVALQPAATLPCTGVSAVAPSLQQLYSLARRSSVAPADAQLQESSGIGSSCAGGSGAKGASTEGSEVIAP